MSEPYDHILGMRLDLVALNHDRDVMRHSMAVDLVELLLHGREVPDGWQNANAETLLCAVEIQASAIRLMRGLIGDDADQICNLLLDDLRGDIAPLVGEMDA